MVNVGWVAMVVLVVVGSRWHFDCGGSVMVMVVHAAVMSMVVFLMMMVGMAMEMLMAEVDG